MKRKSVLSWDEYFMSVAHLAALRSKDPNTQVGACIVNEDNRIIGMGYNGLPKGCDDDEFPWGNQGDTLETKYAFVVHAELNAILNSYGPTHNATIYVSLFPCNECAKAIIQAGIKKIVYEDDKYAHTDAVKASKRMLDAAGIEYVQVDKKLSVIVKEK